MDCYGLIDLAQEKAILFVPRLDNMYKIWMNFLTCQEMQDQYGIEVRYLDELNTTLDSLKGVMFVNQGVNSDSGLTTQIPAEEYLKHHKVNYEVMHDILAESRVIKNDEEILVMRWASKITAEAHCNVLKNVKPGMREI
jgi:Xaa-Pro dipeptidase